MTYIHPADKRISDFSTAICKSDNSLETMCRSIFAWFDSNIAYSRLQAPFFPLQRSDLDVLSMKAGTCGDYSNLLVSVLLDKGFHACYAYVHRDCYGHSQDHICAAVNENGRYILIDATQPYRKWHGFDCPHQEYELLSPDEFEHRMKKEEAKWCSVAEKHGCSLLAGLLYAPWIHAECVFDAKESLDNVFYLLTLDNQLAPSLYVYYQHYTPQKSTMPIMAVISTEKIRFHFSIHPCNDLWDKEQWSAGFEEAELPAQYISDELRLMKCSIRKVLPQINSILDRAGCCAQKLPCRFR